MISNRSTWSGWLALILFAAVPVSYSGIRGGSDNSGAMQPSQRSAGAAVDTTVDTTEEEAFEALDKQADMLEEPIPEAKPVAKKSTERVDRADAFVAGPDWEFDGFVSGGQDSNVRSMFYLNDLIYLNIGAQQGVGSGVRIGIYKRGDKIRDPQTGKFIGYEVRRAAIARVSDRIEDETCAVRIASTYEPVEIGDLVRLER